MNPRRVPTNTDAFRIEEDGVHDYPSLGLLGGANDGQLHPTLAPAEHGESVGHPVFYRRTKGSVTESVARARSVGVPEAVMTLRAAALRSVCDSERACSS